MESSNSKHIGSIPCAIEIEDDTNSTNTSFNLQSSSQPSFQVQNVLYESANESTIKSFLMAPTRLKSYGWILFHVLTFGLGTVGFVIVVTTLSLGIGLIPLCCIGLLILWVSCFLMDFLYMIEIGLHNIMAMSTEVIPMISIHAMNIPSFTSSSACSYAFLFIADSVYFTIFKFVFSLIGFIIPIGLVGCTILMNLALFKIHDSKDSWCLYEKCSNIDEWYFVIPLSIICFYVGLNSAIVLGRITLMITGYTQQKRFNHLKSIKNKVELVQNQPIYDDKNETIYIQEKD